MECDPFHWFIFVSDYLGIICYKYLANQDSAEYQAIRPEWMPGAVSTVKVTKIMPEPFEQTLPVLQQFGSLLYELTVHG